MYAIAEFAMRSRGHAIATSIIAALLPLLGWLSTVIVALVCLRHGAAAGAMILLWTLLPIGGAFYFVGDPTPAFALIGTFLIASLLRQTLSWELVLITAVVLAAIGTLVFELVAAGLLDQFVEFYLEYQASVDASVVIPAEDVRTLLLGFIALGQAYAMLVMLILARWCQSMLYNPGGFRQEFHRLKLSPMISAGLLALMMVCYLFSEQVGFLLPLVMVPMVFAALGLVHWMMATKELSGHWVAMFYVSLVLLFQLIYPLLASLALMDSWLNLRERIETSEKE